MSVEYTAAEHINQAIEETENALSALYDDPALASNIKLLASMSQSLQLMYQSRHALARVRIERENVE